MRDLIRLELKAPDSERDKLIAALAFQAPSGWEEESRDGRTLFRLHLEHTPASEERIRDIADQFPGTEVRREDVPAEDWSTAWKDYFVPIPVGERLTIVPPWSDSSGNEHAVIIEPGQAFGTGHHATTMLMLEAMDEVLSSGDRKYSTFLDLGTGSGILGISACQLGLTGIGLDIDPLAVENARRNIELNRCGNTFMTAAGGLEALKPGACFDLVLANILSEPLISMAEALSDRVRPGGSLLLSGILDSQAPGVMSAYRAPGLGEARVRSKEEWVAIIYSKAG
jgi:ribosomal protein L11 methyltransferase